MSILNDIIDVLEVAATISQNTPGMTIREDPIYPQPLQHTTVIVNPRPTNRTIIVEQPVYGPTFIDLMGICRTVWSNRGKFTEGRWALEFNSAEACLRVRYGMDDVLTIRFQDSKGRTVIGILSGSRLTDAYSVLIGGKDSFWREGKLKGLPSYRIDTHSSVVPWSSYGPYATTAYEFLMRMYDRAHKMMR